MTTALLRSLRRAWPDAGLDVLTLRWSAPALAGNPDVTRVLAIEEGAGVAETLRAVGPPRRYDLALSTLHSDRPHFIALWAAGRRVSVVPHAGEGAWWKRRLSTAWTRRDGACHMVAQYLALADCLGIPRQLDLVPPRAAQLHPAVAALRAPYAVVHPAPMYRYKRWTVSGWRALVAWLGRQGLHVVLSGGPAEAERRYVAEVADGLAPAGVTVLAGQLDFPELTGLIERAALFVGPDTSVTHLAAATGSPTVALFGPTTPIAWGPWPKGLREVTTSPWRDTGAWQQQGNVWLIQGVEHCVPCHREGCERHRDSRADCLDGLPAARVIAAAAQALARKT